MPTDTDEEMTHYFRIVYNHDTVYAKDMNSLYYRYNRQNERWGELPERIDKIECPMSEWREFFGE